MVRTLRPKARDTPRRPIPTLGNAAASTALPQPPRTSQKVPMNSATVLFPRDACAMASPVPGASPGVASHHCVPAAEPGPGAPSIAQVTEQGLELPLEEA